VNLYLPEIQPSKRRDEREFWTAFEGVKEMLKERPVLDEPV